MVETMIWRQKQQLLEVLDQTKLPQECEFIACKDYQRVKNCGLGYFSSLFLELFFTV